MVEYIKYKGEKYPIRIAWSTIKRLSTAKNEYESFELALWYGLVSGHAADNKELTLKQEDVEFILDESLDEFKKILDEQVKKYNVTKEEDSKKN